MSEEFPTPPPVAEPSLVAPAETVAEKAEAAAIRRRWITLGEIVAIVGLIISALALWNSWAERRDARAIRADEQAAAREAAAAERRHIGLVATDAGGDALTFKGVECALQSTDISFPTKLGATPRNTVLEHRIEASWVAKPLLSLTDGGADRKNGRLPVLIKSQCIGVGGPRVESAIYDVVWETEPHLLGGRSLKLRGMMLRRQVTSNGQQQLDALWTPPRRG